MNAEVDPFSAPYFARALAASSALLELPIQGEDYGFAWVARWEGPSSTVFVVRRANPFGDGDVLEVVKTLGLARLDPSSKVPLQYEALHTNELDSPRILLITQFESRPDTPGGQLARMPYCEGLTLRERLQDGPIDITEAVFHLLSVAASLSDIHANSIVHRDIHPGNIFHRFGRSALDFTDHWRTVVGDLGISVRVGEDPSGYFRGTPLYAAPEQMEGAHAHPAFDIWAWGVVAFELVSLPHPFKAVIEGNRHEGLEAVAEAVRAAAKELQRSSAAADFEWLYELAAACLRPDPVDRPTAEQLLACFAEHVRFDGAFSVGVGTDKACVTFPLGPPATLLVVENGWPCEGRSIQSDSGSFLNVERARRYFQSRTTEGLLKAIEACRSHLGDYSDPESVAALLLETRSQDAEDSELKIWEYQALTALDVLCASLLELLDRQGLAEYRSQLAAVAAYWESVGRFADPDALCRLAQAHIYLGNSERAAEILQSATDKVSDQTTLYVTARLLHRTIGNFDTANKIAISLAHINPEGTPTWLNFALIDAIDGNDLDSVAKLVQSLPEEFRDVVLLPHLVAELHAGRELDPDLWKAIRSVVLSVEAHDYVRLRLGLEIAWHSQQEGDIELARKRANQMLREPALHLPMNRCHLLAFEAMAAGIDPRAREASNCLEARAFLWDRGGQPIALELRGQDVIAAELWLQSRWARKRGFTPALASLVQCSLRNAGIDRDALERRRFHCSKCWETYRYENIAFCVRCRGLFCPRCRSYGDGDGREACRCGGDVVG